MGRANMSFAGLLSRVVALEQLQGDGIESAIRRKRDNIVLSLDKRLFFPSTLAFTIGREYWYL